MADGSAAIPSSAKSKNLRACLLCSIVQTSQDFRLMGCPNCGDILGLKGNPDRIISCTTTSFDGVIAVIDPETSWVAKWQRISQYHRGIYAARVKGRLPDDIIDDLESQNIRYRPRDHTQMD